MLRFLPLLLVCGCVTTHDPEIADTKLDESKRDWAVVFEHEIQIAIKNQDYDAYYFFVQELIKELYRREHGEDMPNSNPTLKFIKD